MLRFRQIGHLDTWTKPRPPGVATFYRLARNRCCSMCSVVPRYFHLVLPVILWLSPVVWLCVSLAAAWTDIIFPPYSTLPPATTFAVFEELYVETNSAPTGIPNRSKANPPRKVAGSSLLRASISACVMFFDNSSPSTVISLPGYSPKTSTIDSVSMRKNSRFGLMRVWAKILCSLDSVSRQFSTALAYSKSNGRTMFVVNSCPMRFFSALGLGGEVRPILIIGNNSSSYSRSGNHKLRLLTA